METKRAKRQAYESPKPSMLDEHVLIRQVRSADLRQITEIERQSFQNPWSSQLIAELMLASTGGSVLFNVAVTGDHVVGYAVAEMVGPELHLTNLAVTFQCRNRGIGCKLTRSLEDWGWKSGGEEVWLEVREHNSLAIGFYRNLGYQIRGRRKAYYHNPREDALLMSKLLIASKD